MGVYNRLQIFKPSALLLNKYKHNRTLLIQSTWIKVHKFAQSSSVLENMFHLFILKNTTIYSFTNVDETTTLFTLNPAKYAATWLLNYITKLYPYQSTQKLFPSQTQIKIFITHKPHYC